MSWRVLVIVACAASTSACLLETNGEGEAPSPTDAGSDVVVVQPDGGNNGAQSKLHAGLAAGAVVCTSPNFRVIATLGQSVGDDHVVTSPNFRVIVGTVQP